MNFLRLLGCVVLCEAAGIIAAALTAQSVRTWYPTIVKPSFTPPNWLFGPAWTILYALMGIALYLVWQKAEQGVVVRTAVIVFFVQLGLNALWSFIFFGMQSPFWAFVEIVLLWMCILTTIILFWKISTTASLLLVPYILWVTYASVLTFAIWQLNR